MESRERHPTFKSNIQKMILNFNSNTSMEAYSNVGAYLSEMRIMVGGYLRKGLSGKRGLSQKGL